VALKDQSSYPPVAQETLRRVNRATINKLALCVLMCPLCVPCGKHNYGHAPTSCSVSMEYTVTYLMLASIISFIGYSLGTSWWQTMVSLVILNGSQPFLLQSSGSNTLRCPIEVCLTARALRRDVAGNRLQKHLHPVQLGLNWMHVDRSDV
jgi:hypothetical protein